MQIPNHFFKPSGHEDWEIILQNIFSLALKMYVLYLQFMFNELFIINPYTKTKQNNVNDEFVKINRA